MIDGPMRNGGPAGARFTRRNALGLGAGLAAGAVGTSALASCGRQGSGSKSVTMWVYPLIGDGPEDKKMWDGIIGGFKQSNPDIDVSVQVQPWDRRVEKLTAAMAAGRGPDIWYINVEDIPDHAAHKRIIALDDILSKDEQADYLPAALRGLSYDNKLWAAPILFSVMSTFYNTKLFKKVGASSYPDTWSELLAAGPEFKKNGIYLTEFDPLSAQEYFFPLIYQSGGKPYRDDGSPAFNSPEGIESLNFIVGMFNSGYIPKTSSGAEDIPITETPLGTGAVAVGLPAIESSGIKELSDAWGDGALRIGPPLKNKVSATGGTDAGYAISSKAADRDSATAWLRHIVSVPIMKQIDKTSGYFAPRKSVGRIHGDDAILGRLEGYLPLVQQTPSVLGGRQIVENVLGPALQAAVLGQKGVKEALDQATADAIDVQKTVKQGMDG